MAADPTGVRAAVRRLPAAPGVYRFRDEHGRVLYIGRATELRYRVDSYWGDLRGRRHLSRMVARIARVEAATCDSVHEAAWLERNLLEHGLPPWNRVPGGQEVPVYLRLDDRPGAPGLHVVHSGQEPGPGRLFGPYLGGAKARLAVAALGRVLPLAYAGARLDGAARDLARVRGVAPPQRAELVAAVAAVLDRDVSAPQTVYDLTVSGLHTFYAVAGGTPVLVHNCSDLIFDEASFPDQAHTLAEHVRPNQAEAEAIAHRKTLERGKDTPNSVFIDQQTAQQVVDYALANNANKIRKWMAENKTNELTWAGTFGRNNSLGTVYYDNGRAAPKATGNGFFIKLVRAPKVEGQAKHPLGYYVQTCYPQ